MLVSEPSAPVRTLTEMVQEKLRRKASLAISSVLPAEQETERSAVVAWGIG